MKKVYIAAPLGGDVSDNIERAKKYAKFAFECGMAPVIPHFYALILDDSVPEQRALGMKAGLSLIWFADEVWCFSGRVTPGMKAEIKLARQLNVKVRYFREKQNLFGGITFYETKKGF